MMKLKSTAAALVLLAATGTAALTAPPPATAGAFALIEERVYVETTVDSDHNGRPDRVAIDISRPATGGPVPVVFEHSPYRTGLNTIPYHNVNVPKLPQENLFGGFAAADGGPGAAVARPMPDLPGWYDDYFVPRGYAVVMGHSIGTGDSEGCPTSGDAKETAGAVAVIDWLNGRARAYNASGQQVTASWSTGNVGMIGVSYNGTLPNAVAAAGTPGLKAIVPIAAISNWYDYYRANGLVVAPGGYQGEDADILAKAVVKRTGCDDEIASLTTGQDRVTGDYTQFWRDRDYLRQAANVTAGVFVIHGQADWNVKGQHYAQWWDTLRANNVPRKIWLHRGGHGPASRSDYQATVGRWFDQFLKGIDTGILTEPKAEVQYGDGTWQRFADWPDPAARDAVYQLGATSAAAPGSLTTGAPSAVVPQTFTDNGRTATPATLVASPDSANANRLVYRTAALTQAARLSGVTRVSLRVAVENRNDANLTALLVDYGSSGTPVIVTRGWIDPQNRGSREAGERVVQGQEYTLTFAMQPKDYVFASGRRIGLVVISTDYDFTLRPPAGARLRVNPAGSTLTVPLVAATGGGGCPGYTNRVTATLAAGATAYHPTGSYYYASVSGAHKGCLDGPDGTDFDLYLEKWNGSAWATVASSTSSGPDETVNYNGTAGYYRYRVRASTGGGSYTIGYNTP